MFQQMRAAAYMAKTVSRDYTTATAAELFDAATVVPADWLGRSDLGRLAPGACADITIVDLARDDSLRLGPVRDPIRTLVESAVGDDVSAVIIGGRTCVAAGRVAGVDLAQLRREAQADAETQWRGVAAWDPLGRSADERNPPSYPTRRPAP